MTADELRRAFLDTFASKGHAEVPSAPLIPRDDPTLLFVNAGMVQFKKVFLGIEGRPYSRAVSCQKCVRAGGKHNDLENVGYTARHHTFFEMLGNFSFGDYFKAGAIEMGWEFLTARLRLPAEKLWITIFERDDEAADLWQKIAGVPAGRIVRMGEKDNFWAMGETGPCGPCSEILIDQGEKVHAGCPGIGRCDCDRYLELWNLVFMQYNRNDQSELTLLPKPSIDTGMGLERLAAVVQGVYSNFDSDLFTPITAAICEESGGGNRDDVSVRVIADHLRATVFLIADGVLPSNEGRGYVLRRILRRASRHGRILDLSEPFLFKLTERVIERMGGTYPEISAAKETIRIVTRAEEERFLRTLAVGLEKLGELIESAKSRGERLLPGAELFRLYDTYGFPSDLAQDVAREEEMMLDLPGFNAAMTEQRERARRSWVGAKVDPIYESLLREVPATKFSGYQSLEEEPLLLALMKDGKRTREAREGEEVDLVFDATPFYGESGGQVGDRGLLIHPRAEAEILDTQRPLPSLFVHRARVVRGTLVEGERYRALVDRTRRISIARNHTGTHILHATLRELLGDHVKQAGSLVAPSHLRFDFSHYSGVSSEDLDRIEEAINEHIRRDDTVSVKTLPIDQALSDGALAFFGEKYGEAVRVVTISDFSKELCGGTHCSDTGEVGLFKIIRESAVAAGVRRIEALTGEAAYRYIKKQEADLREVAGILRAPLDEIVAKSRKMAATIKEQEREIERLKSRAPLGEDPLAAAREVDGVRVVAWKAEPSVPAELRRVADQLRDRIGSGVILIGSVSPEGDKAYLSAMVTSDLASRISAADIVREAALAIGGTGGGRPEMAQAGGKWVDRLDEALASVFEIVGRLAKRGG